MYKVGSQRYSRSVSSFEIRCEQDGGRLKNSVKATQIGVLLLKLTNSDTRSSFCISTSFRIGFFNPVPKYL
ncbi:hypothetical protein AQI84_19440 [Streptomyces griseorubiginosus]|nr:hypothetical protein AQI84_19440 [Streptomyces griseorubiginosus]